jgi:uncharacterized OB-fold protein
MTTKERVAAVDGWFTLDDADPRLLGNRCTRCGSYFFPKASAFCRNPSCDGTEFEEVPLSNRGTVWSFTTNHYAPPPPYLAADPFEPFSVAAVQLPEEKMVVLGQVAEGVDPAMIRIGDKVELVLGTLFEDDDHEYVVWKWKPIEGARSDG